MRRLTTFAATLLIAGSVAAQCDPDKDCPFEEGDPYIPDPYGDRMPNPIRHRSQYEPRTIENPYHQPDISIDIRTYGDTFSNLYREQRILAADADIRSLMLRLEDLIVALQASNDATRLGIAGQREGAQADLRAALEEKAPQVIANAPRWPEFQSRWYAQIPPLMKDVATMGARNNEAACSSFVAKVRKVDLPNTPAHDIDIGPVATALTSLMSACESGAQFAQMEEAANSKVTYAGVAGQIYWRSMLYQYLDPAAPAQ